VDLVRAQLLVSAGERLPFRQDDLSIRGHAVECRVYAEDPAMQFLPQAGPLLRYREPQGPGVRVDAGVREGQDISVHYDPMIAKLVTSGESREAAFARATMALRQFEILGLRHNIPFLLGLLAHADVVACRTHTRFIEDHLSELTPPLAESDVLAQVALAAMIAATQAGPGASQTRGETMAPDPWTTLGKVAW
jgi:acetyl/propionyl-CoA carboxylase alpha subunit